MRVMSRIKWHVRRQKVVGVLAYLVPNIWHAMMARGTAKDVAEGNSQRVALCLRFRDEARFLDEWLTYHLAAGVEHFFLYNNFSVDDYESVLQPYVDRGCVTVIDWPRKPASPDAENDCIARARGRFGWVGFLDADEFVVIRDGRSIPEFLSDFPRAAGVALHWIYFGSSGHRDRPVGWVIDAYRRRAEGVNRHFKVFVRPEKVVRNRNSHNFYFRGAHCAVAEDGRRVFGSLSSSATAERAWINHYYCKSLADYLEKASRRSSLDRSGMTEPSRLIEAAEEAISAANELEDHCALTYFQHRRAGS